jgi:hypothetical protein
MSKVKIPSESGDTIILPIDKAFEHLLNKNWFKQSEKFRNKYKSARSKYNAGNFSVSMDKKKEMLLSTGYAVSTDLSFVCPNLG